MMFKRTMAIATGLLLAASGLTAQRGQMHGQHSDSMPEMMEHRMMMGGMMGQGMGMMATGGPGPAMILRMSDALELTDEQTSRLESIRDEFAPVQRQHMSAGMAAHKSAAQALEGGSPDFSAYEDAMSEAASHMVQAHVAMARASLRAREVLTEEQRQQLERGMQMMRGMGGGPGMGAGRMKPPGFPH